MSLIYSGLFGFCIGCFIRACYLFYWAGWGEARQERKEADVRAAIEASCLAGHHQYLYGVMVCRHRDYTVNYH